MITLWAFRNKQVELPEQNTIPSFKIIKDVQLRLITPRSLPFLSCGFVVFLFVWPTFHVYWSFSLLKKCFLMFSNQPDLLVILHIVCFSKFRIFVQGFEISSLDELGVSKPPEGLATSKETTILLPVPLSGSQLHFWFVPLRSVLSWP